MLFLLVAASRSATSAGQCVLLRRSFLLTAAGQLRIRTGFPLGPETQAIGNGSEASTSRGAAANRLPGGVTGKRVGRFLAGEVKFLARTTCLKDVRTGWTPADHGRRETDHESKY